MIRIVLILTISLFLLRNDAVGQKSLVNQTNEDIWIIQLKPEVLWTNFEKEYLTSYPSIRMNPIAPYFNIYGINVAFVEEKAKVRKTIQSAPEVLSMMKNYVSTARLLPDDELYSEQWALPIIQADQTWLDAKGDSTATGDKIVIAIVDNGFRVSHPDLKDRLWENKDEIPNNGVDDDNNGYIDDYNGWNFQNMNDQHPNGSHGSPVAGIVGATTDNGTGIAGTAYRTTLMPLSTPSLRSDRIISAMEYAFLERKRYNETDGNEGAFIVAVNFSLGLERTFPDSASVWCAMHDSLGKVGILSIGSVTNSLAMIDTFGDIPAMCASEHVIAVTRTDIDDELSEYESGFSEMFVDLGAPGDGILSTSGSGEYRAFDGTSAAAPFVAGAIATLYSIPCETFALEARQNPAATALAIKDIILDNVDALPSLQGKTVSGGRLNIYNALVDATSYCDLETAPFDVQIIYPNPSTGEFHFNYIVETFEELMVEVYDLTGKKVLERIFRPQVFGERQFTVDIGNTFSDAVYLVKIQQGNDRKWGKILLQKHD